MSTLYDNTKKPILYNVGLYLSIIYVLFGFIANGTLLPYTFQKIALYGLLGYGALVVLCEISRGCSTIPSYSLWYLLVIFLCFLTVTYSNRGEIIPSNLYSMIVCFLLTFIITKFIRSKNDFLTFCWGNVITSIVMVVLLYASGNLVGTRLERLGDDISGNANVFAMGMMYPCMFAIWLLIYGNYNRRIKGILILTIIVDMYSITLSAGRKSFILPFVFLYLLLVFKKGKQKKSHLFKYTTITLFLIVVTVYLVQSIPVLYESIGIRIEQMINSVTGKGVADNSSLVRSEFRKIAIEGWLESPIWGNGFDSFKLYAGVRTGHFAYSHCNQTELLFCGGLILFLAYYGGFILLYTKANDSSLSNEFSAFAKAAVISEFIFDVGLVAYNVFLVQSFIMMAFVAVNLTDGEKSTVINTSKYIRR